MISTTFGRITGILENDFQLEQDALKPDAALADLGLDSLALMEFVFAVEDAFGLRIPEERLNPREAGITLQRLCDVIDEMKAEPASSAAPGHLA